MKRLLTILAIILSAQLYAQTSSIECFGGIYNKQVYFNWAYFNKDTLYFTVQMSMDGIAYQDVYCDSLKPSRCMLMHSIRIPTSNSNLLVKLTIQTQDKVIDFEPQFFKEGLYTYAPIVPAHKIKIIHANL